MIKFNGSVKGESVVIVLEEKGVVRVELEMNREQCERAAGFFLEAEGEMARAESAKTRGVECAVTGKVTM